MCIGNNFSNIFCSLMIYLIINRCILKVFLTKILIFIPIYENILIYATKKSLIYNQGLKRADDGNRTRDLRLTKATLYRLSHSSIYIFEGNLPLTVDNNSRKTIYCQQVILNFILYSWRKYVLIMKKVFSRLHDFEGQGILLPK